MFAMLFGDIPKTGHHVHTWTSFLAQPFMHCVGFLTSKQVAQLCPLPIFRLPCGLIHPNAN